VCPRGLLGARWTAPLLFCRFPAGPRRRLWPLCTAAPVRTPAQPWMGCRIMRDHKTGQFCCLRQGNASRCCRAGLPLRARTAAAVSGSSCVLVFVLIVMLAACLLQGCTHVLPGVQHPAAQHPDTNEPCDGASTARLLCTDKSVSLESATKRRLMYRCCALDLQMYTFDAEQRARRSGMCSPQAHELPSILGGNTCMHHPDSSSALQPGRASCVPWLPGHITVVMQMHNCPAALTFCHRHGHVRWCRGYEALWQQYIHSLRCTRGLMKWLPAAEVKFNQGNALRVPCVLVCT
jgi:hypothetical protein